MNKLKKEEKIEDSVNYRKNYMLRNHFDFVMNNEDEGALYNIPAKFVYSKSKKQKTLI